MEVPTQRGLNFQQMVHLKIFVFKERAKEGEREGVYERNTDRRSPAHPWWGPNLQPRLVP